MRNIRLYCINACYPFSWRRINSIAETMLIGMSIHHRLYPLEINYLVESVLAKKYHYSLHLTQEPLPTSEAVSMMDSEGHKKIAMYEGHYMLALNGNPRHRFTLAHEVGHFILGHMFGKIEEKFSL